MDGWKAWMDGFMDGWMDDWLVGSFVRSFVRWLVGWLVGWLRACMRACVRACVRPARARARRNVLGKAGPKTQGLPKAPAMLAMQPVAAYSQCFEPSSNSSSNGRAGGDDAPKVGMQMM